MPNTSIFQMQVGQMQQSTGATHQDIVRRLNVTCVSGADL